MDPTITAAIISSITAATTTAASELGKSDGHPDAVITNKTRCRWTVTYDQPTHGSWTASPHHDLVSIPELESYLDAQATEDGASDILTFAKTQLLSKNLDDHLLKFGGKGNGMGFQGVVTLKTTDHSNMTLILLIDKRPHRGFKAGVSMSNGGWADGFKNTNQKIQHIEDIHTDLCKYSDGGPTRVTKLGPITVRFTAGQVVEFEITDDAYNAFS